jgi:hypothetical protein
MPITESHMHRRTLLAIAAFAASFASLGISKAARADDGYRVSGPVTHENLTVYFIHGSSAAGPVPLTLAEALAAKSVRVIETGSVNALTIENLGEREVFVAAGDIVKGGRQDRVLSVSLVLPPHSGALAITAFCVEQGRWSRRGSEDATRFESAAAAVPTRAARLAIQAAPAPAAGGAHPAATNNAAAPDIAVRQHKVWDEVARVQRALSSKLAEPVASPQSASSLQLALENEKLKRAQDGYIAALKPAGERESDIIGYAFALDGKLDSAEIYPSNALFRKMWPKLLTANATEAIAGNGVAAPAVPSSAEVAAFLKVTASGTASKQSLTRTVELETRRGEQGIYLETRRADGSWVHRSYMAK